MKTIILLFSLIFLAFAVTITQYVEAQSQGVGTVSSSGFSPTEYPIFATSGASMYENGGVYNIRELGDDNVIVGNLINLTNIKIVKITLSGNSGFGGECAVPPCSPNVNATNATMTAKIWSNVTIGSSRFSDLIEEASTETINIQDYIIPFTPFPPPFDSRHPNFPITFNFTTPVTLTGEYLVGFEFQDIHQNLTVVFVQSSTGGTNPSQDLEGVIGVCIGDPTSQTFNFTNVLSVCPDNIQNGSTLEFSHVKDWFFEIIAEKTVSDLSVNTSIAPTKLRGYWTFDDITVDDQIALNAGTVGHEGDATMIDYRLGSNKTLTRNSTGLIGASYIHDGTKNLFNGTVTDTANYLQVGTFTNDNQKNWNFLHQMGTTANKTATSLWIRVNSTSTLPTNNVGFIASQSVGHTGNGIMYGMGQANTEIQIQTWQNDTGYVNTAFDPLGSADPFVFPSFIDPPHFDGQWHNIIINFDKTNSTFPVKVCIDGTEAVGGECRSVPITDPPNFDLTDPAYTLILAPIFQEIDNSFEGFEMDEIAIWEDYLLTDSEIDQVASMSVGSSPDTDGDGIFNEVDTLPNTFSDDFSDQSIGGTSSGTITTRGDQTLTITEETNPSGVRISADVSGGLLQAVVSTCGDISLITLNPGNEIVVTCGSVSIITINGPVEVSFNLDNTEANVTLPEDNEITFDPDFFSFTAPLTNTQPLVIMINGTEITLNPGSTISLGLLKITKLTIGGDDTFDFTVTGPTSYNPSINTDSGGDPPTGEIVILNELQHGGSNGQTIDFNGDFGIDSLIGQEVTFSDQIPTRVRMDNMRLTDFPNNDAALQFRIYSNYTLGVTEFQDLVLEASSDILFANATDYEVGDHLILAQFNFTAAPSLTGTYAVSLVATNPNWLQGSETLEFIVYDDSSLIPGDCFSVIDITNPSSVITRESGGGNTSCEDFPFKVYVQTSTNPRILWDDFRENYGGNFAFDQVLGTGGNGDHYIIGNRVNLTASSILHVSIPDLNCETATNGTLVAKIWDRPIVGSTIIPTVQATSDTWGVITNANSDCDTGGFGTNNVFDITFNFTDAPELTGEYFIGIEADDFNAPTQFDVFNGRSIAYPSVPYDPVVFMGYNTTDGWVEEILTENDDEILGLRMAVIQNQGGSSGSGIGVDGPNPVDPGTYSIQETIPAGWTLTSATCNDGSSSFGVDTISDIVIDSGDSIECTFENEFASSSDTDGDGIFDDVDTLPNTVSDDFSDIGLGGTTSGAITTRGDQVLTIAEEPNPEGVSIAADISGGLLSAVVNVCGEIAIITLSPGDDIVVTCSSVTIDVINGLVEVTFVGTEGIQATASLPQGNSITFDQDTFSFSAPATNPDPVVVIVDGEQIIIEPGQAASVVSSNRDSFIKQGELNTNEGANTMMRVRDNGNNRALISFDQNEILATAQERTLSSATLRLYIEENGNNWGPNGRTIDLHKLLEDWTEGNGFNDKPESMSLSQFNELKTRGDGLGVTWKCATDTEINNQQTNCSPQWDGATFSLTPTDTITIFKDNPPTGTVKTVGWIEFDVTSDLQTFLSTEQNYGWMVKKTEEGEPGLVEFTSDEASVNTPELILVFD